MTTTQDLKAAALAATTLDIEQERREFGEAMAAENPLLKGGDPLHTSFAFSSAFNGWLLAKSSLIERLQAAEDAAKDAERLNWLLDNLGEFHVILFDGATPLMYRGRYLQTPEQLRSAIDARRLTPNTEKN